MLPPSEYLPPLYHSDKKLPVDVYNEWKRLNGAKEDTAKNRYIQLARSMKTYGTAIDRIVPNEIEMSYLCVVSAFCFVLTIRNDLL